MFPWKVSWSGIECPHAYQDVCRRPYCVFGHVPRERTSVLTDVRSILNGVEEFVVASEGRGSQSCTAGPPRNPGDPLVAATDTFMAVTRSETPSASANSRSRPRSTPVFEPVLVPVPVPEPVPVTEPVPVPVPVPDPGPERVPVPARVSVVANETARQRLLPHVFRRKVGGGCGSGTCESAVRVQPETSTCSTGPPAITFVTQSFVANKIRQLNLDRLFGLLVKKLPKPEDARQVALETELSIVRRCKSRSAYFQACLSQCRQLKRMPDRPGNCCSADGASGGGREAKESQGPECHLGSDDVVAVDVAVTMNPALQGLTQGLTQDLAVTTDRGRECYLAVKEKYVLSLEEQRRNSFPTASTDDQTMATAPNGLWSSTLSTGVVRTCIRCLSSFPSSDSTFFTSVCNHHSGRLRSRQGRGGRGVGGGGGGAVGQLYTCCGGVADSTPCCQSESHVCCTDDVLRGFVSTEDWTPSDGRSGRVVAVDCEMCYTTVGLELTRATVVDWDGRRVYDEYVRPRNNVVDYNTRFSGIDAESLSSCTKTLEVVQRDLSGVIAADDIVVGHGLENDLRALKIYHRNVVDTSVLFPHPYNAGLKLSLKQLASEKLGVLIQESEEGHDSYEDARTCIELVKSKLESDSKRSKVVKSLRRGAE